MKRREFVLRLPVISAGVAAATTGGLTACGGAPWLTPGVVPAGLELSSADLTEESGVFVQSPGMDRPIHVRRLASGETAAVLASCTHRGCQPEALGDRLACPCHGSEFTFTGEVISGPADRPLQRFDTEEREGTILIRLPRSDR